MNIVLSDGAAKELGRALRLIRQTQQITLRDAAHGSRLSPQYINNIERGERHTVSEDAFGRLVRALEIPPAVVQDLVLRARLGAALSDRGLSAEQQAFVLKGVEQRMAEIGQAMPTLADVLTSMLSPVQR